LPSVVATDEFAFVALFQAEPGETLLQRVRVRRSRTFAVNFMPRCTSLLFT